METSKTRTNPDAAGPMYAIIGQPAPGFNKRTKGKEDERGQIPSFGTIQLSQLARACRQGLIQEKYIWISDMTGQAATFFEYQQVWDQYHLHSDLKQCEIHGTMKYSDMVERFRKKLLHAMLHGTQLVINMDTFVCAFREFESKENLPLTQYFFNRQELFDWYKAILRKEEDKDEK